MQRLRKGGNRTSRRGADDGSADPLRALHDAEERYRLAARATNDVIWDYDLIAQTVQWNEALTRRFGHAPAGLLTPIAWWEDKIHADDALRVTGSIEAVIDGGGEYWAEEYRLRRADGGYADVLDRGYVIRDERGRGVRMVGAILDLSDRKAADAALRASEERLRLAQDAVGLGIYEWVPGVETGEVTDTFRTILGFAPGAPVTLDNVLAIVHPDDQARIRTEIAAASTGASRDDNEFRIIRPSDGAVRWVWFSARSFFENGVPVRRVGVAEDITERKAADARLRESEEMLRLAQEAAGIGSFEWNLATGEGRASHTAFGIFGLPVAGTIKMHDLLYVIHADDRARVAAYLAKAGAGEIEGATEHRIVRPSDGETRWVRISGRRIDGDGVAARRVGVVEDITERKLAEARLHESEERLRLAQAAAGLGTFDWDLRDNHSEVSESYRRIYGLDPDILITTSGLMALVHPDDRSRVEERIRGALGGGNEGRIEYRIYRASDGALRWLANTAQTFRDDEGRLIRRIGVVEDITERKEAEARLSESEENYRYTVELSPQLAWTADGDGSNIEFKRELPDIIEAPAAGDTSDWADRLTHPDDLAYRRREWEFSLRSGRPYDAAFRVRRNDGEYRWVRSRGYPRRDESGRIVKWYGVVEEIHAQRAAEQQLQRLQAELSQVARVSAMGTLASTLAHELNQPLTAVANYLAGSKRLLMNHGATATPVIAEALESASKAAIQAGEIVRRLRDLVSRGEVNAQRVELAGLIQESCELTFGDVRDRTIELSLEFGPDTRTVLADRIQLQQVLVNLLRNAAEAMADSPTRVITLTAMPSGDEQVTVRVEDSGPGVSPEVKRHLFSPFVTTKESGMGVGLSICRSIVEAHGGQLWVEDAPSGGAAFCFTLHRPPADS